MCVHAARDIAEYIKKTPDSLLCLAAGDTPTGIYRELARLQKEENLKLDACSFIGLDEWVGLSRTDAGSCTRYIYEEVFEPLKIKKEKIFFFDAAAEDLQEECRKANAYLDRQRIDIAVMGVGMNGHIGLNEPGTPFDSQAHVAVLSETTRRVAQKYFEKMKDLTTGITLGLGQIRKSRLLMVVAAEEKKAEVMAAALQGTVSESIPASFLQEHRNCRVYLDAGAAKKLENG